MRDALCTSARRAVCAFRTAVFDIFVKNRDRSAESTAREKQALEQSVWCCQTLAKCALHCILMKSTKRFLRKIFVEEEERRSEIALCGRACARKQSAVSVVRDDDSQETCPYRNTSLFSGRRRVRREIRVRRDAPRPCFGALFAPTKRRAF